LRCMRDDGLVGKHVRLWESLILCQHRAGEVASRKGLSLRRGSRHGAEEDLRVSRCGVASSKDPVKVLHTSPTARAPVITLGAMGKVEVVVVGLCWPKW